MNAPHAPLPLLTFPDADKSPLSIRAKALVFFDPRSHEVRDEVERLAPLPQPVLIHGETGTGKELLARHIHRASERPGLFVAVSCSALSRNYADAELFGYAPGAHNGPVAAAPAGSARPMAAPSISTRSPTCRCRCNRSCCACCRNVKCCASARASRCRWTCVWSPPPVSTWGRR